MDILQAILLMCQMLTLRVCSILASGLLLTVSSQCPPEELVSPVAQESECDGLLLSAAENIAAVSGYQRYDDHTPTTLTLHSLRMNARMEKML